MDSAVSEQEQDLIDCLSLLLESCNILFELVEERSKECWSTETNLWKCFSINLDDVLDTSHFRILWVAIDCEAMLDTVDSYVPWDSSKSEYGEAFIIVVWLDNLSNRPDCRLVWIVRAQVV